MVKRIKSRAARDEWKAVLADVQAGETIIIEHYNRPIAKIIPYEETTMKLTDIAADIARDNDADYDETLRLVEELAIQNAAAEGAPDGPAPVEVDEDAAQTIREAYTVMAQDAAEIE